MIGAQGNTVVVSLLPPDIHTFGSLLPHRIRTVTNGTQ